jgi:hypothetical protein
MNASPRHLTRVRLELARTKGFPEGSREHGYEFVAPLDPDGHLDAAAWKSVKERCRVRRFWGAEDDDIGHVLHRRGAWVFHYDIDGDEDDEAGYKLAQHTFNLGDYVSIRDEDGELNTFRVVAADTLPG